MLSICPDCGQKHDNIRMCIMSKSASYLVVGFLSAQLVTISKFNKFYNIFPSKELYNGFALLVNLPSAEEIESLYKEDFTDMLLLTAGNVENTSLFDSFFFNKEEYIEEYRNDADFSSSVRVGVASLRNYLSQFQLKVEDIKQNTGKSFYVSLGE